MTIKELLPNITLENTELVSEFIAPYIWEGELWIDGGLGPVNKVNELVPENGLNLTYALYVEPVYEQGNNRYKVCFAGEHYKSLLAFIEGIKPKMADARFYLVSFPSTKVPEVGSKIYQLTIHVTSKGTTISIEQGNWIPSFKVTRPVAGWSE